MINVNGTICVKSKTGGGLTADGYPAAVTENLLGPVPCSVRASKVNYLARSRQGNTYVDESYTVLIEADVDAAFLAALREGERVNVLERDDNLGDFSVIQIEHLDAIGLIRITV
jgi:hypothetical protein